MDEARVVRLRTPPAGGGPPFRFGSGYLIGPGLVLTAGHTVQPQGDDTHVPTKGDPCQVLPWDGDPEFGWWDGRVEECDLELDLAVVSVRGLAEGVASLPWGRLEGSDPVPWKAVGFPVAGLDETGRQPEHTWGEVSPVTASPAGRLGLVIRSRETRPTARGTSGWAGLSGAAVFCNDRLVGVVIEDPEEFTESLTARRVDRLANNELLYIAAGSPVFEGVSAESADDPGQDAPCQLRAPAKDFTGREEEVEQLVDALARHAESEEADLAIAVISGMPGIGKTELAVQVGHELRKSHDFPDGQLYVDLRGAEEQSHRGGEEESDQEPAMEPLEVLGRFLRALGAQGGQIGESLQERMDDYNRRLKNRRVLLVLDNAADEGQVEPLLPYEGRCAVIVTSRARLTFPETDVHIDLPVLSTDEAQELFTRIAGKKQGIGDNRSVREIVELCGNLPLAVRIAGANLATKPNLTPQRLARSLSNEKRRLALLKRGDRQVRASFALSYRGLLPGEQLLFRLLGILPAQDFAVWGAAALIGRDVDDTEELVTGLVDAQLLQFIGDDESDLSRYRFHDLLRLFARESLEEEESAEVQRAALERLISACVALTDFAAEVLRRSEEHAGQTFEATWPATDATVAEAVVGNPHGWFSAEQPTLIWAVQQGYEAGRFEATWRLAGNLADFFDVQGYWSDWQNTHEVGLEAARLAEDRFGEAAILQRLGLAHLRQGEGHWRDAIGCLEQSRGLFDELREPLEAAVTRRNLGRVYREQEQWDKATESYEQCLTAFRALGNRHWEARTLRSLADVHYDRGDLTEAVGCFRQCIQIYDDLRGNPRWKASVLRSLGDVYRRQKRWDEAIDSYKECLKVFKEMSARWWTAATLRGLGNAYRAKQQWDEAIRHYEESIRIFEELGNRRWQAKATASLGVALAQKGDHDAAAEQWRQALTTFDEIGAAEAGHVRAWLTAAGERDLHR